ncbi:stage II sporulation protein M [Rossellomorea aquimaris]|nr:stage II sporulation protein M [Rossellomorea aquimaris]WRP06591.1 stage II sporulation protein M [Rossellomorea aquimaris]
MRYFPIKKRDIYLMLLSVLILSFGICTGLIFFSSLPNNPSETDAINSLAITPKYGINGAIQYFVTNIIACSLLILGLVSFGIPTIFGLFLNGLILGVVIDTKYMEGMNILKIFTGIMTHGILELPALIIAGYIGLKGFSFYFDKNKEWKKNLKLILLITGLLIGAGLIEALITPLLIQ